MNRLSAHIASSRWDFPKTVVFLPRLEITTAIVLLFLSTAVHADDPKVPPPNAPAVVPVEKDAVAAPQLRLVRLNLNITPEMLVFGSSIDADAAEKKIAAALEAEIQVIDRFCSLSETQRRKLQLAGRRDIRQFFERFEELRSQQDAALEAAERRQLSQDRIALGKSFRAGLFVDESLFKKTLRGTLSNQQRTQYAALLRDRCVATIETVLTEWDQRALDIKLTADSRRKLAELLFDKSNPPMAWSTHTYHVLLLQMAALEAEVRPLFPDAEWPALQQEFVQARDVEPLLTKMGVWPVTASTIADAVLDEREE